MSTTKQILEALLFASDAPVGLSTLVEVLDGPDAATVADELRAMAREFEESGRGVTVAEIAGGYQLLSRKECAPWIERMLRSRRKVRLSRAGLETLAIVAYKQPISRAQVAAIRGVDPDGVLRTLQSRGYIDVIGRDPGPGQALLFGTTQAFLEKLGLDSVDDLPPIAEFIPGADVVEALEAGLRVTDADNG
jgi:segregation and condensation protein B